MPSRVIRGEINRSDSLSRVSMQAELTFDRLLTAVDDYGRLDARPAALKAELFPMRDEVTAAQVVEWVRELAALDDPPVQLYFVNGREYLALVNWERHRGKVNRGKDSKFPKPPDLPRRSAEIRGSSSGSVRESREECVESREEESAVEATAPPAEPAGHPPDPTPLVPPSEPAASAEREPPERRAAQPLPLWSYTAADRLIERVRGAPGGRIPPRARSTWAAEIARMPREIPELGAMERPEERVLAAIEWLFGPENSGEYALVVRSGRALREKWPRIVAAAKRARAKTQPREDLEAWARGADHLLRRAT